MIHVQVKPLSVNRAYNGRKVASPALRQYKKDVMEVLPEELEVPEERISINLVVEYSSKLADIDNCQSRIILLLIQLK